MFSTIAWRRLAVLLILALPACSGAGASVSQIPSTGDSTTAAAARRDPQSARAFAAICLGPYGRTTAAVNGTCPHGYTLETPPTIAP